MAERSKAPDLRLITSQHTMGAGVLVSEWRRGFEYHSWQCCIFTTLFFCIFRVGLHQIQRPCKECYSTQYRGNWLRPSRILQNERGYRDSGWSRYPNTEKFDREAATSSQKGLSLTLLGFKVKPLREQRKFLWALLKTAKKPLFVHHQCALPRAEMLYPKNILRFNE